MKKDEIGYPTSIVRVIKLCHVLEIVSGILLVKGRFIMKKSILFIALLFLFISYGCSKEDEREEEVDNKPPSNLSGPKKIFENNVKHKVISKQDVKKDIKLYLDSSAELSEISEYYQDKSYDEKLSENDDKNLKKIKKRLQENDRNFQLYIENNEFPTKYKDNLYKIHKYIYKSNQFDIETFVDDIEEGKISRDKFDKLYKDTKEVNGKEQKKIEDFLKEENIKTKAFKK